MTQEYNAGFKHVSSIGDRQPLSSLEENLKSFLDWSFVNIGAFINVNIPTSGIGGTQYHKLKLATDPSNNTNTVWEAEKKDWIHETGISFDGLSPTEISGVYLNGTFLNGPSGYGSYTYSLDYKNGRVIFDNPVNQNSDVELEYSYRHIQTYKSSEQKSLEISEDVLASNSVELPAVFIEMTDRTDQKPFELGNSRNTFFQDVLFHVLARNATQRNNIANALLLQKDRHFYLYDIDNVVRNGVYPFDYKGNINNNRINYDLLFKDTQYIDRKAFIKNATITEFNIISNTIYHNIVRWTIEIFP